MQPDSPLTALFGARKSDKRSGDKDTPKPAAQHDHDQFQPKSLPAPRPIRRGGER